MGYCLLSIGFLKCDDKEGKFILETKLNKYMQSSNDRAIGFKISKPQLKTTDFNPTLEESSTLDLNIFTQKTVRHFSINLVSNVI